MDDREGFRGQHVYTRRGGSINSKGLMYIKFDVECFAPIALIHAGQEALGDENSVSGPAGHVPRGA